MRQIWGGGAGEKNRLQYFEFGLQYLVQPLGVNPTYSTFKTGFVVQGHILPGEDLKNTYRLHVSSIKFYACYSA